ncbi:hypothetical protein NKH77_55950 [Streptomyces sp. M19]
MLAPVMGLPGNATPVDAVRAGKNAWASSDCGVVLQRHPSRPRRAKRTMRLP